MSSLSEAEQVEKHAIAQRLLTRIMGMAMPHAFSRYIKRMDDSDEIDLLRCLDKFLTNGDTALFFDIESAQNIIRDQLERDASSFLTAEMLEAMEKVTESLATRDPINHVYSLEATYAFLFSNMDRAEDIIYLIVERSVVNPKDLASMLDMKIADHIPPLRNGVL